MVFGIRGFTRVIIGFTGKVSFCHQIAVCVYTSSLHYFHEDSSFPLEDIHAPSHVLYDAMHPFVGIRVNFLPGGERRYHIWARRTTFVL